MKIGLKTNPINVTIENYTMPFGKYRDSKISTVPTETLLYYLNWDKLSDDVREMINLELKKPFREKEVENIEQGLNEPDIDIINDDDDPHFWRD